MPTSGSESLNSAVKANSFKNGAGSNRRRFFLYLSRMPSLRYFITGERRYSITRRLPVLISAVRFEDKDEMLRKVIHCLRLDSEAAGEASRQALFNKVMSLSGR